MTRSIGDREFAQLGAELDDRGFGALPNYLSETELQPIRAVVRDAVRANGGDFVLLEDSDQLAATVLGEVWRSPAFIELCRRLCARTGAAVAAVEYRYVRCLQGPTGQRPPQVDNFHFDAFVVSALLPIEIPDRGGDFLLIPNLRPVRRSHLLSFVEHHLVAAPPCRPLWRLIIRRRWLNATAIRLQPGTLYFFWGSRSIHANERSDPNALRATALFFYGKPDYATAGARGTPTILHRRRNGAD